MSFSRNGLSLRKRLRYGGGVSNWRIKREPKVVVAVRLDRIDVEYLDDLADEHDANRSDVIRNLIAEHQSK